VITSRDGQTTSEVSTATVPAAAVVTVTREDIEPLVAVTRTPGAPVVTTQVQGTGETCMNNPSNSPNRGNSCPTSPTRTSGPTATGGKAKMV
jgi:hypothetical protein